MTGALVEPEGQLRSHFRVQEEIINLALSGRDRVNLIGNWDIAPLVVGLGGAGCELASRNRGPDVQVAPLILLADGLWAWLGFREEWDADRSAGKTNRFSFRSVNLTIHFGYRNLSHKPQMFRAEWAGWSRWNGSGYGHQAEGAGHPHWQFDAVESISGDERENRAKMYLSILRKEGEEIAAREFAPESLEREEIGDLVAMKKISRLHFASAAAWWKRAEEGSHIHVPESVKDVQAWARETMRYLVGELARL